MAIPILVALTALLAGVAVLTGALALLGSHRRGQLRRSAAAKMVSFMPTALPGEEWGSLSSFLTQWLRSTSLGQQITTMVTDAELSFSAGRFVTYLGLFATLGAAFGLFFMGNPLTALILAAAGVVIPYLWLQSQAKKRVERFLDQLPEALLTIANAVHAGAGMIQAVEQAADELRQPMSDELRRVIEEFNVGRTLEEALIALRRRIPVEELDSVIAALLIHRRSGGDLGELLTDMATLLKEDVELKREMRVQTAQAQLSARIVGVLPVLLFLWMRAANPEFLAPLTSNWLGIVLLTLAFGLEVVGFIVIQRITVIEE